MTAIIFLNAFGAGDVSAQSTKNIRASVPFDFLVGERIFPAGVYYLESISRSNANLLQLRSFETKKRRLLATNELLAAAPQSPKLVFRQIGAKYYLTSIFMTEGASGFTIREKRRQTAKGVNPASVKTVEVAAKN
jgi:hypothetical protein